MCHHPDLPITLLTKNRRLHAPAMSGVMKHLTTSPELTDDTEKVAALVRQQHR